MYSDASELSSELSSVPSSPSLPPGFYPTPISTQDFDGCSTPPIRLNGGASALEDEGMPPAKKRRKVDPKPRTTQYLDLSCGSIQQGSEQKEPLDLLLKALRKRRKIVVIAGAGISVSAGIPDFRSADGLFKSLRNEHKLKASGKHLFDASVYKSDSSTSSFHDMVRSLSGLASSAKPTAFHQLLARLAYDGRLMRLYTQNVDGIETSLPPLATQVPLGHKGPWPRTIQLHGGLEKMVCQKCSHTSDFRPELFQGPDPPLCPECTEKDTVRTNHAGKRSHGIGKLRPRIVLYNEYNPDEEAIGAVVTSDLRSRPDAVIVVGTSLKIPGVRRIVREMCGVVRGRKHGVTMWINQDSVPMGKEFEDCWDLIIKSDCDEVARHTAMKNWDDDSVDVFEEQTASDVERVKEEQGMQVIIESPRTKALKNIQGIATPPASQDESTSDQKSKVKQKGIRNPASNGRSLSEVLGKEKISTKPSKSKRPSAKKAKAPGSNLKVVISGRVTKTTKSSVQGGKVTSTKTLSTPMLPLSPHTARNNGPIMFPGLVEEKLKAETPSQSPQSPRWRDRETISPTGSVPPDIAMMLN